MKCYWRAEAVTFNIFGLDDVLQLLSIYFIVVVIKLTAAINSLTAIVRYISSSALIIAQGP